MEVIEQIRGQRAAAAVPEPVQKVEPVQVAEPVTVEKPVVKPVKSEKQTRCAENEVFQNGLCYSRVWHPWGQTLGCRFNG